AEQRLAALAPRAADTMERANIACLRMVLYVTRDQGSRAIAVGLDYLAHAGIEWSPHPPEDEARRGYDRVCAQVESRTTEELLELPLLTDPASLATLAVLTKLVPPAFYTDVNLVCLAVCRPLGLSLEHGNSDASAAAYVRLGM